MSEKQWTASEIIHLFNTLDETQGLKIKHDRAGSTDEISFPKQENIELSIESSLPKKGKEMNNRTFLRIENKLFSEDNFLIPTSRINDVIIIANYEQYVEFWSNRQEAYR